jgi:hypothetical protein
MTTADIPTAAKTLLKKLDDWSVQTHQGSGEVEFGGLSEETDGEGKRHRISAMETVDSYLVRATHIDGRAFVAIWMRRATRKGWSLDTCWRGRALHEHAPKQLTATELKAYVAPVFALEAVA